MKTREMVTLVQDLPVTLWRDAGARERCWQEMRVKLAAKVSGERPGWTLAGSQEDRHALYLRTDPDHLLGGKETVTECSAGSAEFVRLRLSCWAAER
jgi:hypothetical protein